MNNTFTMRTFSDQLRAVCKEYQDRIAKIESEKWDIERQVASKDYVVIIYLFLINGPSSIF